VIALAVGQSVTLRAVGYPGAPTPITWVNWTQAVRLETYPDGTAVVTGVRAGQTSVTAFTVAGAASLDVAVGGPPALAVEPVPVQPFGWWPGGGWSAEWAAGVSTAV
jgi:hypothetical protein